MSLKPAPLRASTTACAHDVREEVVDRETKRRLAPGSMVWPATRASQSGGTGHKQRLWPNAAREFGIARSGHGNLGWRSRRRAFEYDHAPTSVHYTRFLVRSPCRALRRRPRSSRPKPMRSMDIWRADGLDLLHAGRGTRTGRRWKARRKSTKQLRRPASRSRRLRRSAGLRASQPASLSNKLEKEPTARLATLFPTLCGSAFCLGK